MRLIDADALLQQIAEDSRGNEGWYGDTWEFINTIKDAPTIDAVPVVRCRDCKRFKHYEIFKGYTLDLCEEYGGQPRCVELDDFCSHGVRRANEID